MAKVPKRSKKTAKPKKVVRSVPKKRAVRRTKEFKRRSEAAIKGWIARRLKQEIKNDRRRANAIEHMVESGASVLEKGMSEAGAASVLKRGMRERKPTLKRSPAIPGLNVPVIDRIRELEQLDRENKARIAELEAKADEVSSPWVQDMDGWIKQDGTKGVYFSRLRTLSLEDQNAILIRMGDARLNGHLNQTALEISQDMDCPLREVFTLFMSP